MLKDLNLNFSYTSEEDDIFEDFFVPALSNSIEYKRAVGYFSLGVLLNTPAAISELVSKNGEIKLLFAKIVSNAEFDTIKEGISYSFPTNELPNFQELLNETTNTLLAYRVRLLAYLFSTGKLKMKVALRRQGIFHQKIGLMRDETGDLISFNGSMNETESALHPELNSEEITVFKSWKDGQQDYVKKHARDFDRLWSNESSETTYVCELPDIISENLNIISQQQNFQPTLDDERKLIAIYLAKVDSNSRSTPRIPKEMFGREFKRHEHQKEAQRNWKNNGYHGILELATGTGKTITAIYAATKLAELNKGFSIIISAPYVDLADQWVEELKLFNIQSLKCYGNRNQWYSKLSAYFSRNNSRQDEFIAIVVVNRTLQSKSFQTLLQNFNFDRTMFIGDECHHHGSISFQNKLPSNAKFKLGLSATPFHYMDENANDRLKQFYGDVVYSYTLYQAIENGILTPYEYHPIPVILTNDEASEYHQLTDKIGKMISVGGSSGDGNDEHLKALLMRRARLVGTASNKLVELEKLVSNKSVPDHSLFYCSDGSVSNDENNITFGLNEDSRQEIKQRMAVGQILRDKGVTASPFTANETRSQRKQILSMFKEAEVKSLIAIKCLDEGIDIPACSTAYLLASSRNPRQFIQRRGRILRKASGKDKAVIYDFVVVLPDNSLGHENRDIDFFKHELERVADFAKHSINPMTSLTPLHSWLKAYDLFHLVV